MKTRTLILALAVALSGCAGLSGYDAKTSFACKAPDGVLCESMSGIYARAMHKALPGQRATARHPIHLAQTQDAIGPAPLSSGEPIRRAPRVLRVWFAPWEDRDGDLHDQNYVYLMVDTGEWLIEHNRQRIEDAYRPVHVPPTVLPSDSDSTSHDDLPSERTVQTGEGEERIDIGVRQDRPSDEQAEDMLDGMMQPGVSSPAEPIE